jgi:uncharacterized membrane protein YhaH (DUF805 family)
VAEDQARPVTTYLDASRHEEESSMEWYLAVLRNYAGFAGRARRKEYWFFALFNFLIALAIGSFEQMFGIGNEMGGGPLSTLYSLGVFVPSLAVSVRRLHDTDRSGLWLLLILIPLIGFLVLLYFMVQPSEPGTNEYGPCPVLD